MTEAALVLGKFYPPHAGHLNLLRAALAARASVVVLCLGGGGDSLRPQARLSALLEDAAAAGLELSVRKGVSSVFRLPASCIMSVSCVRANRGVFRSTAPYRLRCRPGRRGARLKAHGSRSARVVGGMTF